jgi:hypothetical protein
MCIIWLVKGLSIEDQHLWKTDECCFLDTSVLLALGAYYATLFVLKPIFHVVGGTLVWFQIKEPFELLVVLLLVIIQAKHPCSDFCDKRLGND